MTPETMTPETMQLATQHFLRGQLEAAERLCAEIVSHHAGHAGDAGLSGALNLLGMIAYQRRSFATAIRLHRQAIRLDENNAYYQSNLGGALEAEGKLNEAAIRYRRAILLKPDLAEAHYNLANVLRAQGKQDEAIRSYWRALQHKPRLLEAHTNLGNVFRDQGRLEEALACYQEALTIQPECAEAHANWGNILRDRGDLEAAMARYRHAIALQPRLAEAHYNLAMVLQDSALEDAQKLAAAAVRYECALAANPALYEAHYNLGCIFTVLGDAAEALVRHRRAIMLRPAFAKARLAEALMQLLTGDFEQGWTNYEWRWKSCDHDSAWRAYLQPLWTGDRLQAGRVLIWGEQGIGDEIMFAGLIADALATGNRCVLDCDARLRPLFARSFPEVEVVSGWRPETIGPGQNIAAHLPSGSLPSLFRKSAGSFPAARSAVASPCACSAYLVADGALRAHFRARYQAPGSDGLKEEWLVGLAWESRNEKTGLRRSCHLEDFGPLFAMAGLRWISLQYGDRERLEAKISVAQAPLLLDESVDQIRDLDTFAAQIAALDLVVTIDNSTAHLAAALGVPVLLLLPFAGDWRWLESGETSAWYPGMRIFRQAKAGDWGPVLHKVKEGLVSAGNSLRNLSPAAGKQREQLHPMSKSVATDFGA